MKYSSVTSLGQTFRTYGIITQHNVLTVLTILKHEALEV